MTALDVFWVGLGGGLGSLLRWWIGLRVGQLYKGPFPLGTFLINVSGAFVLGLLLELLSRRGPDVGARRLLRLGLGTGVMGGYTTYSTFALETVRLLEGGALLLGLGYALGSVLLGLAAAWAGTLLAIRIAP